MSEPEVLEDDKKKVHKLQVWVTDDLFAKIMERARATNRHTSAWIRAALEKHFTEAEAKTTRENGVLDRLERLLQKFKG